MDVFSAQVAAMMRPETYPIRVRRVTMRPTHMAIVFLTERHVWKLRRPVQRELMDFRTSVARWQDALNEWRLDSHFAPGVCLGLAELTADPVRQSGWSIRWASSEHTDFSMPPWRGYEGVLCMRRLPASGMLDQLTKTQRLNSALIRDCVKTLAERLASRTHFEMDPVGLLNHHRRASTLVLDRLRDPVYAQSPRLLDRIEAMLPAALDRHRIALARRADTGCIRDGHGDLRPEHVCVQGAWVRQHGPVFIDALEFDAALRRLDTLDEIAGLAVSCEFLGSAWAHRQLRLAWQAQDPLASGGLWSLAAGRHALKRALHAAWHLDSPCSASQMQVWRQRSSVWLHLACEQLSLSLNAG